MTDVTDQLTDEEKLELQKYLTGTNAPSPEEKHSIYTFLHKISISDDTTKTGYLTEEELGMPINPVRTFKKLSLISSKIIESPVIASFFADESEIVTSTSLSKHAKLLNAAVTMKRQLEDTTKPRKQNRGWFKKKEKGGDEE